MADPLFFVNEGSRAGQVFEMPSFAGHGVAESGSQ